MDNSLFNSDFAKNSKFENDFVGNILSIKEWHQLVEQFKKYISKKCDYKLKQSLIPKKIHQIWLGEQGVPKKSIKWMNSWKEFNPDWEYKLWDEENIKELKVSDYDVYSKKINPGYRSDILRYIILNKFGGLYADTDFECLKSIPTNILQFSFIAGIMFGNKPCIGNSILISSPNSFILKKILNNIKIKDYKNDINYIIKHSGPHAVTKEYFSAPEEIKNSSLILPSNYFYPFPNFMLNNQTDRYNEVEEVSIGIHHWEMTWMKGNLIKRIQNKLKNFLKHNFQLF